MLRTMVLAVLLLLLLPAAGCSVNPGSTGSNGGTLRVIAGENFWGSLATQLGGSRATVQSVVSDPNADPHEYETSTNDARAFAEADLVILNGAGYDDWGRKLLSANPGSHRRVLDIAAALGRKSGDNPHFWYDPALVVRVADRITSEYSARRPADASYFSDRRARLSDAMKPYQDRVVAIRAKFSGVKVGATENVFAYLASALGLELISPPEFMQAVAEGTEPPSAAVAEFQRQVSRKQIRVLVYNRQTATAVTTNLRRQAAGLGIPVVGMSETLPTSTSFQDWQLSQLIALESALNSSAGP